MDEHDRIGRALGRVYLILCIAFLVTLLIRSLPDHQRAAVRMRALRWCALATSRLARRAGVASMSRELATGDRLYGLPYRLSVWRDRLNDAYDEARG